MTTFIKLHGLSLIVEYTIHPDTHDTQGYTEIYSVFCGDQNIGEFINHYDLWNELTEKIEEDQS